MRDEHYRRLCDSVLEYDRIIDWIKENNPFIKDRTAKEKEQFASNVVNSCIRAVVFGDAGNFAATGMCIAVSMGPHVKTEYGEQKVCLAVKP